jgi:hypothetical protein
LTLATILHNFNQFRLLCRRCCRQSTALAIRMALHLTWRPDGWPSIVDSTRLMRDGVGRQGENGPEITGGHHAIKSLRCVLHRRCIVAAMVRSNASPASPARPHRPRSGSAARTRSRRLASPSRRPPRPAPTFARDAAWDHPERDEHRSTDQEEKNKDDPREDIDHVCARFRLARSASKQFPSRRCNFRPCSVTRDGRACFLPPTSERLSLRSAAAISR